ncbi:RDD family protein [Yinghuangia soli]|uniref:RDD family protein n=1 Tax=Yinghuangia soli TaxID=2908204 RepID=A0AA41TY75_9ACTN|nr:RDD family protein [Yinghuangia soli]MCF2526096.1 RDD family protein [Yinghuangia soli]
MGQRGEAVAGWGCTVSGWPYGQQSGSPQDPYDSQSPQSPQGYPGYPDAAPGGIPGQAGPADPYGQQYAYPAAPSAGYPGAAPSASPAYSSGYPSGPDYSYSHDGPDEPHKDFGLRRKRVLARVLDLVLLVVLWAVLIGTFLRQIQQRAAEVGSDVILDLLRNPTADDAEVLDVIEGAQLDAVHDISVLVLWFGVAIYLLPLVYEFVFLAVFGRTPGKMLCGLAVRAKSDPDGRKVRFRGMIRALVFTGVPSGVFYLTVVAHENGDTALAGVGWLVLLAGIAALWLMLTPARRGLHDLLSGTVVVSTR